MPADDAPLLELRQVSKTFRSAAGETMHAVRAVSLAVHRGETLALVGESGSGKSTLGRIALGLIAPDAGEVRLDGHSFASLSRRAFRTARRTRAESLRTNVDGRRGLGHVVIASAESARPGARLTMTTSEASTCSI